MEQRNENLQSIREWVAEIGAVPGRAAVAAMAELYGLAEIVVYGVIMATLTEAN